MPFLAGLQILLIGMMADAVGRKLGQSWTQQRSYPSYVRFAGSNAATNDGRADAASQLTSVTGE
jgi:hypothetical protein